VALLVAIDGAPEISDAELRPWDPRYWIELAANFPSWLAAGAWIRDSTVILRRSGRWIVARARHIATRQSASAPARLERLVSLYRYPPVQRQFMTRLYDAIMTYIPRPWDGALIVYEARAVIRLPQYMRRWRSVMPQAELALLKGNHGTILMEPRVADLARDLDLRIARAVSAATGERGQW
jgi:hypothetical protein